MDAKCEQIKDFITTELPKYDPIHYSSYSYKFKEFLITTMQLDKKFVEFMLAANPGVSSDPEYICSALLDKKRYEKLLEWINDPLVHNRNTEINFRDFLMISELKDIKKLLSDKRQLERELEGSKIMLKSLTSKFKKSRAKSINKNKKSLKKSKKSKKSMKRKQ